MKKLLVVLSLLSQTVLFGQTVPKGISYQAVAINTEAQSVAGVNPENTYWSNKDIQVRFTIYDQYPGGTAQMVETHQTKTDKFGVFNVIIGQGQNESGDLFDVDWDKGQAHLKVEIDFNNNDLYKLVGIERFWSVPYALNSAGSTSGGGSGPDLSKKLDSLADALNKQIADFRNQINGDIANLNQGDTSSDNELQELELNGNDLGLSKSNKTVDISTILNDNEIGNELQSIALVKDTLMISGLDTFSGGIELSNKVVLSYDKSETNELQELIYRNDSLILTKGNSVKLSNNSTKSSTNSNSFSSSNPNCLNGDFYDLSEWAQNNGWVKIYMTGKIADSLFLFGTLNADNSSRGNFIYDAKLNKISTYSFWPKSVISKIDSLFCAYQTSGGMGSVSIYKTDNTRNPVSTGKGVGSIKPWKKLPILNSKGDVIWVDSDQGLPQDIKKYNYSTGTTLTYTNPNKNKNIGGFYRINRDTILIGLDIYDSKTMTLVKSLPSAIFASSSIEFVIGSFIYFNSSYGGSTSQSYRYDMQKNQLVKLGGGTILLRARYGDGVFAEVFQLGSSPAYFAGLESYAQFCVYINKEGEITRADDIMNKKRYLEDFFYGQSDYDTRSTGVSLPCVNGVIPQSNFGFADYK